MEEYFDLYDEAGNRIGKALRKECHGNPALLHHTAHVMVFHPETGAVLLQKRSMDKDIQPGKWDTAVGGHLALGEDYLAGAKRELREELGVKSEPELFFLFDAKIRNEIESEDTRVFGAKLSGPFAFQKEEIDEVRFWTKAELLDEENHALFTPNLVVEIKRLLAERVL